MGASALTDMTFGLLEKRLNQTAYDPPAITGGGRIVSSDPIEMRVLDVIGAIGLLIVFLPLMLLIALSIRLTSQGPVIFSQQRIGRDGQLFSCYKFRSMVVDAEERLTHLLATDAAAKAEWERDQKLRNDPRITRIGLFLRKSSLDELPQFWNILRGDMSLVGPRPIIGDERYRYGRYIAHYCSVRPGLTGLWQISGRNHVSYRRRVAYDVLYARKSRFGDNIRILLLTVPCVLTSKGSY